MAAPPQLLSIAETHTDCLARPVRVVVVHDLRQAGRGVLDGQPRLIAPDRIRHAAFGVALPTTLHPSEAQDCVLLDSGFSAEVPACIPHHPGLWASLRRVRGQGRRRRASAATGAAAAPNGGGTGGGAAADGGIGGGRFLLGRRALRAQLHELRQRPRRTRIRVVAPDRRGGAEAALPGGRQVLRLQRWRPEGPRVEELRGEGRAQGAFEFGGVEVQVREVVREAPMGLQQRAPGWQGAARAGEEHHAVVIPPTDAGELPGHGRGGGRAVGDGGGTARGANPRQPKGRRGHLPRPGGPEPRPPKSDQRPQAKDLAIVDAVGIVLAVEEIVLVAREERHAAEGDLGDWPCAKILPVEHSGDRLLGQVCLVPTVVGDHARCHDVV
mmetsp:Transcript_78167/g.253716  ORF Transcript_78167/g.253716 Transcript_78167/m.253716 type:complete len:383 (+) Transcript_78167:953-2101(+)